MFDFEFAGGKLSYKAGRQHAAGITLLRFPACEQSRPYTPVLLDYKIMSHTVADAQASSGQGGTQRTSDGTAVSVIAKVCS